MASALQPNTHDMVVIHRIFRRGFAHVAELAGRVPPDDATWAEALARHLEFLLDGLHNHHTSEDEHLWPKLIDRCRGSTELVEGMAAAHDAIAAQVDEVRAAASVWRRDPARVELAGAVAALGDALGAHLDEEEVEVLPLIEKHITAAEFQELGDAAFDKFTNDQKLTALGQLLDVTTPEEASPFLSGLPMPVRVMWRVAGRRKYRRAMRAVDGQDR